MVNIIRCDAGFIDLHGALVFDTMLCRQPFGRAHGSRSSRTTKEAIGKQVTHQTSRRVSDLAIFVVDFVTIPASKAVDSAHIARGTALTTYMRREGPVVAISGTAYGSFVVVLKKASPSVCFSW